jgi:hypothetical protein
LSERKELRTFIPVSDCFVRVKSAKRRRKLCMRRQTVNSHCRDD